MVNALHNNDGETHSNLQTLILMDRIHYIVCTHPRFLCIYILFSCNPHKIMKMCTTSKPGRMSSCKMSKIYKDKGERRDCVYSTSEQKSFHFLFYIIYHERGKRVSNLLTLPSISILTPLFLISEYIVSFQIKHSQLSHGNQGNYHLRMCTEILQ